MNDIVWNPWHGCTKYSEGCKNCYVYRRDTRIGLNASQIKKNTDFDLPVRTSRSGSYKIPSGTTVFTCMTSDFFLDKADAWRDDIWKIIKERSDLNFFIITKRIVRFWDCIPNDWGENGYSNVIICCTVENQKQCDIRLPMFMSLPIAKKYIACEPLLSPIDMSTYLNSTIEQVVVGGESGPNARVCHYDWILDIRRQCNAKNVRFHFKQTGANFFKDGKLYKVERKHQHSQAAKANIDL